MAGTSCMTTTTVGSFNSGLSPDPYILSSKAPIYLRPFSLDYGPRRLPLPPLTIPAQPTRPPPPVPVAAANRSRSHTGLSNFSPAPGVRAWRNSNYVDHSRFQDPWLLLPPTPTTATYPSPRHLNTNLSHEQTPIQLKSRRQSTSSNQQHQCLPQPCGL